MGWFSRRKRVRNLSDLGVGDPLSVVPAAEANVEARQDDCQRVQLRRMIEPKPGLYRRVARLLRYRHDVRVNLDEGGSCFWRQIDGRRDLGSIAVAVGKHLGVDDDEARKAVMAFTRALMIRRLIYLKLPSPDAADSN